MNKTIPLFLSLVLSVSLSWAQVFYDHFDNDDPANMGGAASYTFSEANSELTVTATNTAPFDVFTYALHDPGSGSLETIDMSGNNILYVRAKASNVGTQLRIDVQDANGYLTSLPGVTKTLTTDYNVLEFDFGGVYQDGGYGGTPCTTGPCPVDSSMITSLVMYANAGAGFTGTMVIDYVSFGAPPDTVIASDVFQDHFEDPSSEGSFTFLGQGYSVGQSGTIMEINGDGTTPMWDPLTYVFVNPVTTDTIDIDITGNNKLYVKVKSSVAGTALRIDMQDINSYVSTQGSITKLVDTSYTILEYDYTGVLADLGYGGTPCTPATAPCPVDGSRIGNMLMFIEPGVGGFLGTLTIDYISFGVSLEPPGPDPELVYEDHFNNDTLEWTSGTGGFSVAEAGTELTIAGDGTAGPFAAISYLLHDKDSAEQIFVNMVPGEDKVFIRAKVDSGMVPLRMDLIDSAGFITSEPALTKVISDEYAVYEYNFSGNYTDGGFGGSSCMTGPCPVDPGSITQILLYVDPVQGGSARTVTVDFISIGQPLGEDMGPTGVLNYADEMDPNTSVFLTDAGGFTSAVANDEWAITGDGTAGAYTPVLYAAHNDIGELVMIDAVGSNDRMFIRAKASEEGTVLRVDFQDNQEYVTNLNAVSTTLTTDYQVYELVYSNAYQDGAFGGSPCMTQGCPVDGQRIENLQFFVNPDDGGYNGTVTIDWISFGMGIVGIEEVEELNAFKAYPNPMMDRVLVEYQLDEAASVELVMTNIMGQQVQRSPAKQQFAGDYQQEFDVTSLPDGLYFLQILTNGQLAGNVRLMKQ
ncbi:MAG: T9SS type A sorting domain-containing protein [Bacteroidota bacterium]